MLGRLAEGKGFDVAVRAIAELKDLPQVKLAIFGDGPVGPYLMDLASRLDIPDRVEFRGWSTPKAAWRSSSIGLAIPNSILEGFGLSALEAQSFGIPVGPVSSPASIFMTVTPVSVSPLAIAHWIGAAPRYFGRSDVWTFRHPNFGKSRIVCGKMCP